MSKMPRLIDADAIKYRDQTNGGWGGVPEEVAYKYDIDKMPTEDAVPVVHGRWLYDSGSGKYFCSACDEYALSFKKDTLGLGEVWEECLTDYCPNCGAKLDLEVE